MRHAPWVYRICNPGTLIQLIQWVLFIVGLGAVGLLIAKYLISRGERDNILPLPLADAQPWLDDLRNKANLLGTLLPGPDKHQVRFTREVAGVSEHIGFQRKQIHRTECDDNRYFPAREYDINMFNVHISATSIGADVDWAALSAVESGDPDLDSVARIRGVPEFVARCLDQRARQLLLFMVEDITSCESGLEEKLSSDQRVNLALQLRPGDVSIEFEAICWYPKATDMLDLAREMEVLILGWLARSDPQALMLVNQAAHDASARVRRAGIMMMWEEAENDTRVTELARQAACHDSDLNVRAVAALRLPIAECALRLAEIAFASRATVATKKVIFTFLFGTSDSEVAGLRADVMARALGSEIPELRQIAVEWAKRTNDRPMGPS